MEGGKDLEGSEEEWRGYVLHFAQLIFFLSLSLYFSYSFFFFSLSFSFSLSLSVSLTLNLNLHLFLVLTPQHGGIMLAMFFHTKLCGIEQLWGGNKSESPMTKGITSSSVTKTLRTAALLLAPRGCGQSSSNTITLSEGGIKAETMVSDVIIDFKVGIVSWGLCCRLKGSFFCRYLWPWHQQATSEVCRCQSLHSGLVTNIKLCEIRSRYKFPGNDCVYRIRITHEIC